MDESKFEKIMRPFEAKPVFAGFSGGADSCALLLLLSRIPGIDLRAVHFEHNIRGEESKNDAEWCRAFCEARGIPFCMTSLNVPAKKRSGESIEAAARRLRLEEWDKLAGGKGVVALGHHLDDRVENLFLRLARGSNLTGIASLRPVQALGSIVCVRPLLEYRKEEIIAFLKTENISDWREDSTNEDFEYKRNFLRGKILPEIYAEIEYSREGMAHSVRALEDDADFVESEAQNRFAEIDGREKTSASFWLKLPPALRIRVLRAWLSQRLKRSVIPDRSLFQRFNGELGAICAECGEKKLIPVSDGVFVKLRKGELSVLESGSPADMPPPVKWNWREEPEIEFNGQTLSAKLEACHEDCLAYREDCRAYFDASQMPDVIIVRCWRNGDKMVPFGADSPVKLKKLFSNRQIIADEKPSYPLLCLPDGKIIWLAGVRRSNFAVVPESSDQALVFCL